MKLSFVRRIEKSEERQYLEIPFEVPAGVARIDIKYDYVRFRGAKEVTVIDVALCAPTGYGGASGSNRKHIYVGKADSARGYSMTETCAGTWYIIAGAYHVEAGGTDVSYEIEFTMKQRVLLRGELHCHSTASDGNQTTLELMQDAKRMGLDFLCISDHNAYSQNDEMAAPPIGLTMIPGMELTHYDGHVNLMGVTRPIACPFPINGRDMMMATLKEAKANGAHISPNHPLDFDCPWLFGMDVDMDSVEVWNGGIPIEANLLALNWWHDELCKGRKLAIRGGSDFHNTDALRTLGSPATWVYADSREPGDILKAIAAGSGFITITHRGPTMDLSAGDCSFGDTIKSGELVKASFYNLAADDVVKIITDRAVEALPITEPMVQFDLERCTAGIRFMRFEVWKRKIESLSGFPWLISNAIYIE